LHCTVETKYVHHANKTADLSDEDWMCYHNEIATNGVIENMKGDIPQLQAHLSQSSELNENSTKELLLSDKNHGILPIAILLITIHQV
jgi:hypothetical protein